MSYIDDNYYNDEYEGTPVDEGSFSRLSKRASETIDILTNYKIKQIGFDNLEEFIKEQIKLATASQVEYLAVNGEANSMGSGGFGQVRAGNFQYGDKAGKESLSRAEMMTSQKAISILSSAGLLYAGVDVID